MATEQDPYRVLGLSSAASQSEIASAYRRLLREHHPDTRPCDQPADPAADEHLQHILTAYALLRDPQARAAHDREATDREAARRAAAERLVAERSAERLAADRAAEPRARPGRAPRVPVPPGIRVIVVVDTPPPPRPPATGLWIGPVRRHR
ncbi:J domain-containing protein [Rhodococcus opacus]|uniref:Molecular chaperone DnaJ n=1 Tax=Rhodococcus opacus TaxID=37919 RepID=A0A2S8J1Q7_RHOOP|nr:J domain-containing protein [Rhodococcus opacus]PQP20887.1 molecular chaperone DnaJ [Rhodococcus opacus]